MGGSVGDYKGNFVVVDFEAGICQLKAQFMPGCHNAGGQCIWVVVIAIKTNVIDPSVEVQIWMLGLEGAEDGLEKGFSQQWGLRATGSYAMGDVEPVAELSIS